MTGSGLAHRAHLPIDQEAHRGAPHFTLLRGYITTSPRIRSPADAAFLSSTRLAARINLPYQRTARAGANASAQLRKAGV